MKPASYFSIALSVLLLVSGTRLAASEQAIVLDKFLQEYAGLNAEQIDSIHRGKAVAIVLDSPTSDKVFVFGTVYVEATPDGYLRFANDFDALRKLPSYLAVQPFSNPPRLSDLDGFTIEAEDLTELKNCKPSHCEVQLPSEAMDQFQKSVNWSATDAESQANRLAQQMAIQALQAYQKGGNAALGVYRDKEHPAGVAESFQALLQRLKSLPVYLPDLNHLLLEYQRASGKRTLRVLLGKGKFWIETYPADCAANHLSRGKPSGSSLRGGPETAVRQPLFSKCA